jgi:hypothetical protein
MSLLRELFGPSQEEIGSKLSEEIGGEFSRSFWRGQKVVAKVKEWTITLDLLHVDKAVFTRLRAPYVNADGFRFTIYRKSIFSELGKFFGMQDIEVGVPEFDEAFIIKGTDPAKVRALFAHPPLRELLQGQPAVHLSVKDDEGWFGVSFPEGVDELYFVAHGVIKDVERLKSLYKIFALTLHCLCHLGSAYENDPNLRL